MPTFHSYLDSIQLWFLCEQTYPMLCSSIDLCFMRNSKETFSELCESEKSFSSLNFWDSNIFVYRLILAKVRNSLKICQEKQCSCILCIKRGRESTKTSIAKRSASWNVDMPTLCRNNFGLKRSIKWNKSLWTGFHNKTAFKAFSLTKLDTTLKKNVMVISRG